MEKIKLQSKVRDPKALSVAKLKAEGEIPAVLYGHHVKNQALAVKLTEFEKALKIAGESTIVDLIADGKTHPVIIQDVQFDNISARPLHVDFYEVSMTEKLKAGVQIDFVGESKAVKEQGGVLVKILDEVEVECLPADLPHNFEIDISVLQGFEDSISVKDIKVSDKVKILTPLEEVIAKVQPPRDVEKELEAPVVEDISSVEGAAEEKPAEAGAEGEAQQEAEEKK